MSRGSLAALALVALTGCHRMYEIRGEIVAVSHAYTDVVAACTRCHDQYRKQGSPLIMPTLAQR